MFAQTNQGSLISLIHTGQQLFEARSRTHLRKNCNFMSFWIWTQKGRMIWTLIILQSRFLGFSREEYVIILPIVRNDCGDQSPESHDLVNDRRNTVDKSIFIQQETNRPNFDPPLCSGKFAQRSSSAGYFPPHYITYITCFG